MKMMGAGETFVACTPSINSVEQLPRMPLEVLRGVILTA